MLDKLKLELNCLFVVSMKFMKKMTMVNFALLKFVIFIYTILFLFFY